ncbi:MAG: hypothetical protein M3Z75_24150 [Actinomycetota bacterium]|nr:hypothetical protein [Actinomycetota bacterium]
MSRLVKAGYIACTVIVVLLVAASLGAYVIYRRLDGNISFVKVSGLSHHRSCTARILDWVVHLDCCRPDGCSGGWLGGCCSRSSAC